MPWAGSATCRAWLRARRFRPRGLDLAGQQQILEGEGRERLGTVLGDQHLLLQLHALAAILLADVALDADRHPGPEDAVVAGGVDVFQVDQPKSGARRVGKEGERAGGARGCST